MKYAALALLVLAIVAFNPLLGCEIPHWRQPPNIILLVGDDHGWEETGYNGHPDVKTPVLDEMAANGLRLDRFYAHPSCSPTRGSILTGRHPNRYGTFSPNHSLRPEEITIGHLLGEAGYLRGHFGKWHIGPVKADSPTNPGAMGFDEWVSHDNFFEFDPLLSENGGPPKVYPGEGSAAIVDRAIDFIQKAKEQQKPFLALIWFGSPHEPYSGLPKDLALYDNLPEKYGDRNPVKLTSNETGQTVERPLGEVLRERYAEITAMDRAIGTLREFLKAEDLHHNTLVWYMSDNGTPPSGLLASPLRGRKGQVYEGGIRSPAVIEWPARISTARASQLNTVTNDILPTLCALTETCPSDPRPLDGISLVPLLDGKLSQRPTPIFFWNFPWWNKLEDELEPWIEPELQEGTTPLVKLSNGKATRNFRNYSYRDTTISDYSGARAMLGNRYKLVIHGGKNDTESNVELFDLRADPGEENNLAERYPILVETMKNQLRNWQFSVLKSLLGEDYDRGGTIEPESDRFYVPYSL